MCDLYILQKSRWYVLSLIFNEMVLIEKSLGMFSEQVSVLGVFHDSALVPKSLIQDFQVIVIS